MTPLDPLEWLRVQCNAYQFDVAALYRLKGDHPWPLQAGDEDDLAQQLESGGHFLPLPKEPAALANVLEVSIVDYLIERADATAGLNVSRGTERGYPDLELSGVAVGDEFFAIDVKVARRAKSRRKTQSRITLYTGNTYFRWPELQWPGTFRPFNGYKLHVDVVAVYTLDPERIERATDIELIVHESWRLASRQRSSTTREYIGAVDSLDRLRSGTGEFRDAGEFYRYWRSYPFRTGRAVEQQLRKLLGGGGQ